jgi:hypothetical protein
MRRTKASSDGDGLRPAVSTFCKEGTRAALRSIDKLSAAEISALTMTTRGKRLLEKLAATVDAGDKVEFEKWDDVPEAKLGPLTEAERRALDAPLSRAKPRKRRR